MATLSTVRSDLTRALTAWSVLSLVVGAGLARWGRGERAAGLARQNLAWGAIDLGIAAVGARANRAPVDDVPAAARSLRRLLLLNSALDVGYVAAGLALLRAGRLNGRDSTGDGAAVVAQGAFLLVLDLVNAARLRPGSRTTPV